MYSHRLCIMEVEKYNNKDIAIYPDRCVICQKSFSIECVLTVKKFTNIVKEIAKVKDQEHMNTYLFNMNFFHCLIYNLFG